MFDFSATPVTLFLLLINILVSGYALYMDTSLMGRLSFKPKRILKNREYYRLFTAGFIHVGLAHLAFNMIALYSFGQYMELVLGPGRFLIVYFGAELAAHGLSLLLHHNNETYAAVGASGAVSGIVFGYCLFQPFSTILLFFAPIPAWLFAIGFVALSMYAMKQKKAGMTGGIAHEAHIGGAVGGLLLTLLVEPRALSIFLGQLGF